MNGPFQLLLLDDNPDDRVLIIRELQRDFQNLNVTEVTNAEQFDEALQSQSFHLVITDYQLCWTDGLTVLRTVKKRWPDCPTIMFTGTGSEEIAVEAMKAGLDDYVLKSPQHFVHLSAALRSALEKAEQRRALQMAEEAILRLHETMTSMLMSFPDIVFVLDTEGRIKFLNPAAAKFARDLSLQESLPSEIQNEIEQVLKTGANHLPTTFKNVHRYYINNVEKFYLPRVVAMHGSDGSVFGAAVVLQDVTEFRLLDDIKTNLISTVSHELKTPITSVRMGLYVLLEKNVGPLNDKQVELLTLARDESERLLRTLNNLLDLTRFEDGRLDLQLETVGVRELMEAAIAETSSAAAEKKITVKSQLTGKMPVLRVDRERIIHVLTNLISNAIKHSPENSEVRLRAAHNGNNGVRLSVIDQGPGVPPQYQSRIFDRFFRVPGQPKTGVGLGLAIARDFVKAHGGNIGVHNNGSAGSEFFINLPPTEALEA